MIGGDFMMEDGKSGVVEVSSRALAQAPDLHKGAVLGEPIAAGLGVDYPFPGHLEYAYPPPDGNILTNIVNALIAVPRFYTQVLHLMNKMNLPAPFRPALRTPPLPRSDPLVTKEAAGDLSNGESELESSDPDNDHEPNNFERNFTGAPQKAGKKGQVRKRVKREAILGPGVDKGGSHEAAGIKPIVIPRAPTAIKKKAPVLQIKIVPKGPCSDIVPGKSKVGEATGAELPEAEEQLTTASQEELEAGKLQTSDMLSLPIFKKYAPGNPTSVLYIKNLAKDVTLDDLYYIFGAFFPSRPLAMEQASVKVMQEGRMKGQAFVSLPSTELAKLALAGTHGFVCKGKPMVVQFGRKDRVPKMPSSSLPQVN